MSRPVRWSIEAQTDLADQVADIARDNPAAARRLADAIDRTALGLGDMSTGRPGRVAGIYEKSVTGLPYILAYAITQAGGEEAMAIVRVIHTSRDGTAERWPD
ncbi:MAG: type II toxin-antitoxin system RelE/ParE family toxin [Hyphomonas sp.]|uniref:type II toxin-antitoxin system RelE/ParE family toxin n=1 Tax=Hyphomonas sp. TaxID=87 RepID=UPI0032EDE41E